MLRVRGAPKRHRTSSLPPAAGSTWRCRRNIPRPSPKRGYTWAATLLKGLRHPMPPGTTCNYTALGADSSPGAEAGIKRGQKSSGACWTPHRRVTATRNQDGCSRGITGPSPVPGPGAQGALQVASSPALPDYQSINQRVTEAWVRVPCGAGEAEPHRPLSWRKADPTGWRRGEEGPGRVWGQEVPLAEERPLSTCVGLLRGPGVEEFYSI